jgi:hypothetical protein
MFSGVRVYSHLCDRLLTSLLLQTNNLGDLMVIRADSNRYVNDEYGIIDKETGAYVEFGEDGKPIKSNGREPSWFRGFRDGFGVIAKDDTFKVSELRIFIEILSRLKYGNMLTINQTKWGVTLNMSRESIGRALNSLEKKNVIHRINRGATSSVWRMKKTFAWCGREDNQKGT